MKAGLPSYTEDMKPVILHSDMNNFYASVEILYDPTLRDRPVVVAGDEEARHGIVRLSLFPEEQKAQRRADIDRTLDKIRSKYGYRSIRRAIALVDLALDLDAKEEHIIHPIGFLGTLHE